MVVRFQRELTVAVLNTTSRYIRDYLKRITFNLLCPTKLTRCLKLEHIIKHFRYDNAMKYPLIGILNTTTNTGNLNMKDNANFEYGCWKIC